MDMKSISQKLQDDIRAIMEAGLHPNQQKIDVHEPEKDKITAHDFKKLRAMKKTKTEEHALESAEQVEEEEKKKPVSPFDYKNYTSQIPKKPGELTGHDSKKTSTGTVYTKKPVKEEVELDEAANPAVKEKVKKALLKHHGKGTVTFSKTSNGGHFAQHEDEEFGDTHSHQYDPKTGKVEPHHSSSSYYEEVEQGIAEADELRARGGLAAINKKPRPGQTDLRNIPAGNYPNSKNKFTDKDREEHPANLKAKIKATLGKHTRPNLPKGGVKEEVELDEGSGPKEKQKTPFRNINGPEYKAAADKQRQQMAKDKAAEPGKKMLDKKGMAEGSFSGNDKMAKAAHDSGDSKAFVRMRDAKGTYTATMVRKQGEKDHKEISRVYDKKDVAEGLPNEYTFADYLEAARAQYVDEDAVLVANEAFKNQDITLFSDQSQSPEA